jgi:hypothetical protein
MLQFRSQRTRGDLFEGRDDYLLQRTHGYVGTRWICHAIEHANQPLRMRRNADGFPWVTMVLGSGCPEARDISSHQTVDGFPELVRALLADRANLPDGTRPADLAGDFARSLVEDRLGVPEEAADPDGSLTPASARDGAKAVDVITADVLLATALLTRFYHQVKGISAEAMSRSGEDVATLDTETQMADELRSFVLKPLRGLLDSLIRVSANVRDMDHSRMLNSLVLEVRQELFLSAGLPTLRSIHVQLMTELSWFFLTYGTTVYPGWSDLLFDLSMREDPSPIRNGRPRPQIVDITQTPDAIMDRIVEVTQRSWETLEQVQPSERDTFYDSAASVLREQAQYRLRVRKTERPPVASCFVTSFDIELEMALWSGGTDPFVVALPVNILVGYEGDTRRTASTCWVGCVVRPDHSLTHSEQLARLRSPEEWFVLSDSRYKSEQYSTLPTVVRLNGCPLIGLPPLVDEHLQWSELCLNLLKLLDVDPPEMLAEEQHQLPLKLQHAVLIDEYAAMQQAAIEFFGFSANGEVNNEKRYGLPTAITGVPRDTFARFWMVMGVQMGDSGVRHRFATQMASPELRARSVVDPVAPEHSGVVVNRRIDAAVRDLLFWYGFDVVEDHCQKYRKDLDHYVAHLRQPDQRSTSSTKCPIS